MEAEEAAKRMELGEDGKSNSRNKSAAEFHHPYGDGAYGIQVELMNAVYGCIEKGNVGVFESPTGTGKSLSLICSSLSWLRDHKRKVFEEGINAGDDNPDEPSWIVDHARAQKRRQALQRKADMNKRLAKIRVKDEKARQRYESCEPSQKRQKVEAASENINENAFALDEYESEEETKSKHPSSASADMGLSAETQALMEKLGGSLSTRKHEEEDVETKDEVKIFFCSRTHSQLGQFATELRRVKIPPSIAPDDGSNEVKDKGTDELSEEAKHLSLGSRKNLCINDKVLKLGNATAINERCLELQQSGTPGEMRCHYLPNKENEALVNDFRDHTLAKVRDIEDLGKLGKRIGVCPYYASRAAIKPSEVVTLPYPLLLQKSAREALNLNLKGHVVIIDEAHNLMEAIANIHSVSITLSQLKQSRSKLGVYLQKFRNRLKGKNRVYVTQLVRLLDSLVEYLNLKREDSPVTEAQVHVADLLAGKGVDQINLYKLMRYLQESKLARKVEGYHEFAQEQERQQKQKAFSTNGKASTEKATTIKTSSTPVLTHVQNFLLALTYPAAEGRFFHSKTAIGDAEPPISSLEGGANVVLKYLLLDTTHHFKEIVDDARAVILAGGTMSPMSDYTQHLFHYLPSTRIQKLSCGHVIPKSNLIAAPVAKGPSGVEFDFTFEKRKSEVMINELGHAIIQFSMTIPDGVVVFFPSYAYLGSAVSCWQKNPCLGDGSRIAGLSGQQSTKATIWQALSSVKKIFLERNAQPCSPGAGGSSATSSSSNTRHAATSSSSQPPHQPNPSANFTTADSILTAYTNHIHSKTTNPSGAILLSVLSGSLSEGINFSDRLGRGVIVVGLPFPNPRDEVWRAKVEYVTRNARGDGDGDSASSTSAKSSVGPWPSAAAERDFTENTVMRSVNQCIGRAIRHKNDHAAIILLDRRWTAPGKGEALRRRLPGWIGESLFLGGGGGGGGGGSSSAAAAGFDGVTQKVREFFWEKENS